MLLIKILQFLPEWPEILHEDLIWHCATLIFYKKFCVPEFLLMNLFQLCFNSKYANNKILQFLQHHPKILHDVLICHLVTFVFYKNFWNRNFLLIDLYQLPKCAFQGSLNKLFSHWFDRKMQLIKNVSRYHFTK